MRVVNPNQLRVVGRLFLVNLKRMQVLRNSVGENLIHLYIGGHLLLETLTTVVDVCEVLKVVEQRLDL